MNKQELIIKKEGLQKELEKAKRQAQISNLSEKQAAFVSQKIERLEIEISELEKQILVTKEEPIDPKPVQKPKEPVSPPSSKTNNKRGRPVGSKKGGKKRKPADNKIIESVIEEPESDVEALKESALQRSGFR